MISYCTCDRSRYWCLMGFFSQVNTTSIPTRDAPGTPSKCTATSQQEARPASFLIKSQMEWVALWNPLWEELANNSHTRSQHLTSVTYNGFSPKKHWRTWISHFKEMLFLVWLLLIGDLDPYTLFPLYSKNFKYALLHSFFFFFLELLEMFCPSNSL